MSNTLRRTLVLASILSLACGAPALAGGKAPQTHPLRLEVVVRYRAGAHPTNTPFVRQVLPAAGMRVGLFYARNLLGAPKVLKAATTDAGGRAVFRLDARDDRPLQLHITTESPLARVGHGLFLATHERDLRLTLADTRGSAARKVVTFGDYATDVFARAVAVQDQGHRAGAFARRAFGNVLPRYRRITYAFPGLLGSSSYAPFAGRVVIKDRPYQRSLETVSHESFHCFWYQARGKAFEYYAPFTHSPGERAGNPSLAASEGFATAMGLLAIRDMAQGRGVSPPRNTSNWLEGEDHSFLGATPADYLAWGEDNEMNVTCALIDLVDTRRDVGTVDPRYADEANGGGLPSGRGAMRAIYAAVKASRGRHPSFLTLWSVGLRARYGAAGVATCRANGIPAS